MRPSEEARVRETELHPYKSESCGDIGIDSPREQDASGILNLTRSLL